MKSEKPNIDMGAMGALEGLTYSTFQVRSTCEDRPIANSNISENNNSREFKVSFE